MLFCDKLYPIIYEKEIIMKDNPTSFLSEKFTPCLLPEVCAPRHNLLRAFTRAADNRFIYVGAQAGSGKTVSALLWVNASGRKTIWIGLDRYDNIPSVFYKQLATGLFSLQPDNEAMHALLVHPDFSASPVEHTVRLISEMLPGSPPCCLVLDDMHLIDNAEIIKSLPLILKRLPQTFTILILSRHAAPDAFSVLFKRPDTSIILPEQLRFSEDEIRLYFESLGHPLTREKAHLVYQATDGWAIGVNAIAKSGQIKTGIAEYDFSRYFERQLWDKWPSELREFCLKTAVADTFDTELAKALTGKEDTLETLEYLSRTNSFLICLNENTYRYHHLFQDFLREHLKTSGLETSRLYKTAALYYKEKHDYSKALQFWMDSGDYKGIDSYLALFLFENNRGIVADYADFLRSFFVKEIPEQAYRDFPVLHILGAWYYYLTSRHESYALHMDGIIRNLARIAKADPRFVEYAILAYSVDYRVSLRVKVRNYNLFGRFVRRYTPEGLATAIASFTHNLPYMHRSNLDYSELALDPGILDKIDKTFAPLLGAEWAYIRPGIGVCFLYERNRLEEALEQNHQTQSFMSENSKIEGRICVTLMEHTLLWQLNRDEQAGRVMEALEGLVDGSAQFFLPNLAAYKTRLKLLDGDLASARDWLEQYFVVETDHIELYRTFQHFTTARALMVLGKTERAMHYLNLLENYGENLNRPLDAAEAIILRAELEWSRGNKKEAASLLKKALMLLQPYGFVRLVADEGAAILPALKYLMKQLEKSPDGLNRIFVNDIILAAYSMSKSHSGMLPASEDSQKPVKLSKQQRHMLTLLSQGYRNAEIAEITGLAIPTIKSHTSIAYKKLGVNNAMDAVLKARELGLIN